MRIFSALAVVLSLRGSDAVRFRKPLHEMLVATHASAHSEDSWGDQDSWVEQRRAEDSWMQQEASELEEYISEVQTQLQSAVSEFERLAKLAPSKDDKVNITKPVNSSKPTASKVEKSNTTKPLTLKVDTIKPVEAQADPSKAMNKTEKAAYAKDMLAKQSVNLGNLFKHLKSNIAHFNGDESRDKAKLEKKKSELEARVKKDKDELAKTVANSTDEHLAFQHDRLVNQTRMDEGELAYWSRDRNLQHQMFHSNLKMTHGLMDRVKAVMDACKQAAEKGSVDAKLLKKVEAQKAF